MKLNPIKFALICAIVGTILFLVSNLISRVSLFGQVFVPMKPSQATLPQLYFLNYSIIGVLLIFVVIFTLAWFFAKLYNKFAVAKK